MKLFEIEFATKATAAYSVVCTAIIVFVLCYSAGMVVGSL